MNVRLVSSLLFCLLLAIPATSQVPLPTPPNATAADAPAPGAEAPDDPLPEALPEELPSEEDDSESAYLEQMLATSRSLLNGIDASLDALPQTNVLRAIVGFVALLALAYLAGQPRMQQLERRLNIAHLTAAGLPFLLLGFLASRPSIGILTPRVLEEIAPLLPLGLGWIGFVIGSRLSTSSWDRLAPGTGPAVVLTTGIPLLVIFLASWTLLESGWILAPEAAGESARNAILLALVGSIAARSAPHFQRAFFSGEPVSQRLLQIVQFEQLAGALGMMMVSSFYRPQGVAVSWQLPGTAWVFVTFGLGTILGILTIAILAHLRQSNQFMAALLGTVAFTAGMASFLRLSPIAVSCIAGAIAMNLGGAWRERARDLLERMERPIYFIFLVVAGALWRPSQWQGWVLMLLFVAGRLLSRWIATGVLERVWLPDLTKPERRTLIGAPIGALSVAIVVSAQDLYAGPIVGWIVTAVIGGTVAMELLLQVGYRRIVSGVRTAATTAVEEPRVPVSGAAPR